MAVEENTRDRVWQSSSGEQIQQTPGVGGEGWDYYIDISNLRIPGTMWKNGSAAPIMEFTLPINYNIDSYDFKVLFTGTWGFCTSATNGWTGYCPNDFTMEEGSANSTDGFIAPGNIYIANGGDGIATKSLTYYGMKLQRGYTFGNHGKAYAKNATMPAKSSTYYRSVITAQNWEDTKATVKRMPGIGINLTFTNNSYIKSTITAYKSNSKKKCATISTYSNFYYHGFTGTAVAGGNGSYTPAILRVGEDSKILLKPKAVSREEN